jgi:choline dehydrogenase-like flavoprotein
VPERSYDIIVIGAGAGGGTLLSRLAPSGKRILMLERGPFLPRERANWDPGEVIRGARYRSAETWYDGTGRPFRPEQHYFVGGNTKLYAAALLRFRERDFETVHHGGGVSPEWPVKYRDFAPYYDLAEQLYEVHGKRGLDPTEPPASSDYPFPPVPHEPQMEEIHAALEAKSLHPFHLPLAIKFRDAQPGLESCVLCDTCDGYPCFVDAKADADVNAVRPALKHPNVDLLTGAKAVALRTSPSGREVTDVEVDCDGRRESFSADIVVVSCGAVNSAALLLRSAGARHPNGLANRSGLVGRNYMAHNGAVVLALSPRRNRMVFQKTLAVTDFYWGEEGFEHPMGSIQAVGAIKPETMAEYGPPLVPGAIYRSVAMHAIPWRFIHEDLPSPDNRVVVKGDRISLRYRRGNSESYRRLIKRWIAVLKSVDRDCRTVPLSLYWTSEMDSRMSQHQCGTCRFGEDPSTSVLDPDCRAHEVDNLYVVDASFFPSSAAVNPGLTIMANALRVGDHLLERMR